MNQGIVVYNASAGSGKTFSLTTNYIAMAFKGDFKQIVAITFTNKATKEMKDRIITVLEGLSNNSQDKETLSYQEKIKEIYHKKYGENISSSNLQTKAYELLRQIIHNYSFFNVSTIDSFFQLILKNLARELNLGGFQLVLNDNKYTDLAVKDLVEQEPSNENNKTSVWLEKFFLKNQNEEKSWNIEKYLKDFTNTSLNNEIVKQILNDEKLSKQVEINNLENVSKNLQNKINYFISKTQSLRDQFLSLCASMGLEEKDFNGRGNFFTLVNRDLPQTAKLNKGLSDKLNEKINKGLMRKGDNCPNEIVSKAEELANFLNNNIQSFTENKLYYDCIFQLGVLKDIFERKNNKKKEDEVFLLSYTGYILKQLGREDVPFIFEKTAQRISEIMIDEFQDTSSTSFAVLKHIIDEALANGGSAYIFGDIKQSIYRWNGGDWTMLRDFSNDKNNKLVLLEENYRSNGNIINFNNDLFNYLYTGISMKFSNQILPQEKADKANEGLVRIRFTEDKGEVLDYLVKEIDYYHNELGYSYKDIGVLFRGNDKIIETTNKLKEINPDYHPVSDIASLFKSSLAVCNIIAALRYINDKKKNISKEIVALVDGAVDKVDYLRQKYYKQCSLLELVIELSYILNIDDDAVFLPAFYDAVKDYAANNKANINDFLEYWEEQLSSTNVDMEGVDGGLNMTSIHKSKGLAYKVVIVPYCSWGFYNDDNVWLEPQKDIGLPIFATTYNKLKDTIYEQQYGIYSKEKNKQEIDNINLLYVAFTRAKDHLSIISDYNYKTYSSNNEITKKDIGQKSKNAGQILWEFINSTHQSKKFVNKDEGLYIYNDNKTKPNNNIKKHSDKETIKIDKIEFNGQKIKFTTGDKDELKKYFEDSFSDKTKKEQGMIYHDYVSKIKTKEDIKNVVMLSRQTKEDENIILSIANKMMADSDCFHWFDGTYKVLNEKSILFYDDIAQWQQKRPDRIMINNNEVIVVDYKFGKKEDKYYKQVKDYIVLLKDMDIFKDKNIKGYLWYIAVDKNITTKIEEVK